MAEYCVDEFVFAEVEPSTFGDEVEKKISLLYDFCILKKRFKRSQPDEREEAVRQLLHSYKTPTAIDNAVRGVLTGNYSINEMLKRKGLIK